MNKKLIGLLSVIPVIAIAAKGVDIVPIDKMNLPEGMKNKIAQRKQEEKEKGYYEETNESARNLLTMKRDAQQEIRMYASSSDTDTHLKDHVKLAFPFVKPKVIDSVIGYAPAGSYIADKGWTGVGIFFEDKNIGTCTYTFFDLKLSHGLVQLNRENTEYLVNKKPSSRSVQGNKKDGFSYNVDWFTPYSISQLECATLLFDSKAIERVIKLANVIDVQRDVR